MKDYATAKEEYIEIRVTNSLNKTNKRTKSFYEWILSIFVCYFPSINRVLTSRYYIPYYIIP